MEYEYNQIAKFYNAYSHTQRWLLEFVEDMLIENHIFSGTLVDLGCGSGVLFEYLEDSLTSIGVDISENLISEAKKNAPHATYVHADITQYQYDKKADVVTCLFDTMNHLDTITNVKKVIDNMSAMLSSGGVAIFDMLGQEELSQLVSQSFVLPLETDFGTAYFQASSEDAKEVEWQIDMFIKEEDDRYQKEVITFNEQYYNLEEIYAYAKTKFSHILLYTASGEKVETINDCTERLFFVCRK